MSLQDMFEAGHLIQWRSGHPNKALRSIRGTWTQVMLISHQWAGRRHPDPKFEQFSVLQQVGHLSKASTFEALYQMSEGNCKISKERMGSEIFFEDL